MMALSEKEQKELKREMIEKYTDKKHGKVHPGVTIGDISDDMAHSNKKEIIEISNEIARER